MKDFRIKLGSEVKSNITGFKGLVTARSEHINGCDRYWVQPKVGKDGKIPEGVWHDDQELVVTKTSVLKKGPHSERGGFPSNLK